MQRDLTICKHWKNFKSGNPHQRLHKMLSKVKNLKQNIDFSIVWYMSWLGWSTFGLVCFSWHGIYLKLRKKKYCCYKLSKVTKWQLFLLTLVLGEKIVTLSEKCCQIVNVLSLQQKYFWDKSCNSTVNKSRLHQM